MFGVEGEAMTTGEAETVAGIRPQPSPTAAVTQSARPVTARVRRFTRFSDSMDDLSPNTML